MSDCSAICVGGLWVNLEMVPYKCLALKMQSANILAMGLYTCSVMHQYIGAGKFTHVSSEAKRAFGKNPFLLSSNK